MTIERTHFFATVRPLFRNGLSQTQVDGMAAILDGWEAWLPGNPDLSPNTRWLAYALATTFHETGEQMVPIREYGEGRGRPYGDPQPNGKIYYGRGYVQLTWDDNYASFGSRMGIPLYDNPDLALDPKYALAIMLDGMAGGHFTGKRLGQYFGASPLHDDPLNARRIINGIDQAQAIAGYHKVFVAALTPLAAAVHPQAASAIHAGSAAVYAARPIPVASEQQSPAVTTASLNEAEFNSVEGA